MNEGNSQERVSVESVAATKSISAYHLHTAKKTQATFKPRASTNLMLAAMTQSTANRSWLDSESN